MPKTAKILFLQLLIFAAALFAQEGKSVRIVAEFVGTHRINMIEGSVAAGRFTSRDGTVVLPGAALPEGETVLGIRPEAVRAATEGEGMKVEVLLCEHLGANRLLHCRRGENKLLAVTESAFAVQEGREVILRFPEADRMWFSGSGGKRIGTYGPARRFQYSTVTVIVSP